ncbi:Ras-related protein Rab-24 [Geodia barretti]|uniref:Ras-related protein Rab-24 n=1 Tax=Geodia barretti TaxID=519541 RepID=A0AA35U139_GEOBA|nr:Ras-related protein Rab-24 [Geodia barretti]
MQRRTILVWPTNCCQRAPSSENYFTWWLIPTALDKMWTICTSCHYASEDHKIFDIHNKLGGAGCQIVRHRREILSLSRKMAGKVDLKVVLLGKEYGGKTSLVERYIHNKFNSNAPYQSTIGAAFGAKEGFNIWRVSHTGDMGHRRLREI